MTKAIEEIHPAHVQIEDNKEGSIDLLLGLCQAMMIDEKVSAQAYLERVCQIKFGSALGGLQSQKIL